jgi:hypothetical protein
MLYFDGINNSNSAAQKPQQQRFAPSAWRKGSVNQGASGPYYYFLIRAMVTAFLV